MKNQYSDYIERICDFKIVASKLMILKMFREYFGISKGLRELVTFVEKLYICEKSGVLVSNEVDYNLFKAVLYLLTAPATSVEWNGTLRENPTVFEGTYDTGDPDYWSGITENNPNTPADAWYESLPKEHRDFVDQLIAKNQIGPAFA